MEQSNEGVGKMNGTDLCTKCGKRINHTFSYDLGLKQGAVDFGFWLVNAPNKEIHKRKWIEQKYDQCLKELGAKKE